MVRGWSVFNQSSPAGKSGAGRRQLTGAGSSAGDTGPSPSCLLVGGASPVVGVSSVPRGAATGETSAVGAEEAAVVVSASATELPGVPHAAQYKGDCEQVSTLPYV